MAPDLESLYQSTDAALYQAKAGGRDRMLSGNAKTQNLPSTD